MFFMFYMWISQSLSLQQQSHNPFFLRSLKASYKDRRVLQYAVVASNIALHRRNLFPKFSISQCKLRLPYFQCSTILTIWLNQVLLKNENGIFNFQLVFFVLFVCFILVHIYLYCYIGEMLLIQVSDSSRWRDRIRN